MSLINQIRRVVAKSPEVQAGTIVRQSGSGMYDVKLANGQMLYRMPSVMALRQGHGVSITNLRIIGSASKNVLTVTVSRADGDRVAPQIQSNLVSTVELAEMRGNRYLDDPDQGGFYMTLARNLSVPHKEGAATARYASVQCTPLFGYDPRIFRINSYSWAWTKDAGTKANIEIIEWHVPG